MTFQTKGVHFNEPATVIPFASAMRDKAERKADAAARATDELRRPPTLVRAAKWRAARYKRGRDLPRLASGLASMTVGSAGLIRRLADIEEECWRALKDGAAVYTAERHVLALAALLAERRNR